MPSIIIYAIILVTLYATKKRTQYKVKYLLEFVLVTYVVTLVIITGVGSFRFENIIETFNNGYFQYKLIPFIGMSIKMFILNTMLFMPIGFLLPCVFIGRIHLKSTFIITAILSSIIEFLQIFIGRFVEIDDVIANILGGMIGFLIWESCKHIYNKICKAKRNN